MKKITVLFTVLMMLAASSAWALTPTYPQNLNGTTAQYFTGFQSNASSTLTTNVAHNRTMEVFNSTKLVAYTVKSGGSVKTLDNGSFYGNIGVDNTTAGNINVYSQDNSTTPTNSSGILINQSYQGIQNLIAVGMLNSTTTGSAGAGKGGAPFLTPYYMISTGSQSLMAGINNSTFSAGNNIATELGINFALIYNASTFADVYSTSDTWDMYGVGVDFNDNTPYYIIGQVQLTSAPGNENNVQAKYVAYNYDGATYDKSDTWYNYNATDGNAHAKLTIARPDSLTLVENATINSDKDFFAGYVSEETYKHFVVFVKNGQTMSTNDIKDRGFKVVYAGHGNAAKYINNSTGGIMGFQADSNLGLKGDALFYAGGYNNAVLKGSSADLDGYSVAINDTDYFKSITQSNMTITSTDAVTVTGAFYGKQSAAKTIAAGIYKSTRGGSEVDFNLAIMIPNSAVVGTIAGAGTGYQNNATIGAYTFRYNNTAYSDVDMKTIWTGIPSTFTPLTGTIGFNSTVTTNMGAQRGDIYYTFQIPFSGIGNKISTLDLIKLFPTSDATVRTFSYASEPTTSVDGAWWISSDLADGYMSADSYLVPSKDYYINYVLKDNGDYDYRTQAEEFGDPVVLGTSTTSSSSSSSGCVFNPAAGFGLEWLLLMLAPMVAIVRSRFKK